MNINNQAENKKPFGTRLFILFTVCMIVVAMAVPAFAADYGSWPADLPDLRDSNRSYIVLNTRASNGAIGYRIIRLGLIDSVVVDGRFFSSTGDPLTYDTVWVPSGASSWGAFQGGLGLLPSDFAVSDIVFTDLVLLNSDKQQIYPPPPPPDLGQEVTGSLPTVLSWIQQTLNALFVEGGALQGLLLLVAVPVAITLLLLGARFIRSVIWGA